MDPTKPGSAGAGEEWPADTADDPPSSLAAASQSPSDGEGDMVVQIEAQAMILKSSKFLCHARCSCHRAVVTNHTGERFCSGGNLGSGSTTEVRQDRGEWRIRSRMRPYQQGMS